MLYLCSLGYMCNRTYVVVVVDKTSIEILTISVVGFVHAMVYIAGFV